MSLLSLPDEILLLIVELLNDNKTRPSAWWARGTPLSPLLSLNLVCHQMNTLTESHLYKRLQISFHKVSCSEQKENWTQFDRLLDALAAKPYRYAYIESLNLGLFASVSSDQRFQSLLTLLRESKNVKTVALNCNGLALHDASLFEPLSSKKVHSLEIATAVVEDLTRLDILRGLRSLSITDAIEANADEDNEEWWKDYELPLDRQGISPLQHLDIASYESHPCTVVPILSWAKALRSFGFNFMAHSNYFLENFSLTQLQRILDIHSDTLEWVSLTTYSGGSTPDFRHFPNLRELHVSHYEFFDNHPQDAAYELAAPRLASITVDFDMEDQQCFVCQEYEETHSVWLQRFGRIYRSNVTKGGIRHIEVINVNDGEDDGYQPLKDTKAALEKLQISFAWLGAFEDQELVEEEEEGEPQGTEAANSVLG